MKKIFKRSMILFLAALSVTGCSSGTTTVQEEENFKVVSDKYIVENGFSNYSIVYSSKPREREELAAGEFGRILNKATGATFDSFSDKNFVENTHYLSLGYTKQFEAAFPNFDVTPLEGTNSAYYIATKNENIYIVSNPSGRGNGTLYGVLDMLHDLVNFEYYHEDEIYFDSTENVNLLDYKARYVYASFDNRAIGTKALSFNDSHNTRLRLINTYRGQEWATELYGHGQVTKFVSPTELDENGVRYGESHPDWFANAMGEDTKNQLCYTGGPELANVIAKKFIYYFTRYPNAKFFMFGQEDNKSSCQCDRCKAAIASWAGAHSGLQIALMNDVIDITQAWIDEHQPGREVNYVVYAYYATKEAPVKLNKDGVYEPVSDRVIPNKNIRFFYAPIECNFAFPLQSPTNSELFLILKQWSTLADGQLIMYLYDTNFSNYFVNFNNFGTVKSMYQTCKDYGVDYMYTQGAMDAEMPCFDEMRQYVESSLMWNLDLNFEELVSNFMTNYYKEASEYMHDYYVLMRDQYAYYQGAVDPESGSIYGRITAAKLWPSALVRQMDKLFKQAFKTIEEFKQVDYPYYNMLYRRVVREYLSLIYLKVTLYRSYYTEEEMLEMKEIFEKYTTEFGFTAFNETGNLDGLF